MRHYEVKHNNPSFMFFCTGKGCTFSEARPDMLSHLGRMKWRYKGASAPASPNSDEGGTPNCGACAF